MAKVKKNLEEDLLAKQIRKQEIDEMLIKKDEFKVKVGYGEQCVFLTTLSKEFVQVIKTRTHFVFHYLGKEINPNNCFYSTQDYDIDNLYGKDFAIKKVNIEKIFLILAYLFHGDKGKIKFKLKQGRSKTFYNSFSYGWYDAEKFFGKKYKIKTNHFANAIFYVFGGRYT